MTDEEIESYNNQKLCHICKKEFHDVVDSRDSNNDSNDSNDDDIDDEIFDARKTYGDAVGTDEVFKNYYDHEDGSDDDRGD